MSGGGVVGGGGGGGGVSGGGVGCGGGGGVGCGGGGGVGGGGYGGGGEDFGVEAAEGSADDGDVLAWGEGAGDEFDGGVGGAEHEAEALDLLVGDGGGSWSGGGGSVDEESVESGCGLEEGAALWFGAVDEDGGWYDDVVDVSAAAVAPNA